MIKAIGFDIGHTLIKYDNPLNWGSLYISALTQVMKDCSIKYSNEKFESAIAILSKYNTRINPRENEVCSDVIFNEIFDSWKEDKSNLHKAKSAFFKFFVSDGKPYPETEEVLKVLKNLSMGIGLLTDVAYGMDDEFSLLDIEPLSMYIDAVFTSVNVGYRKPNIVGFKMLVDALGVVPSEMLFVGDEEKDIVGANYLGITSVLVNRSETNCDFGQKYTISSLNEILNIIEETQKTK